MCTKKVLKDTVNVSFYYIMRNALHPTYPSLL